MTEKTGYEIDKMECYRLEHNYLPILQTETK